MLLNPLVKIGEYAFPDPSSYRGLTSTIIDTSRNVNGVLIGSVVRDDIAKVELKWNYLTVSQWAEINSLFKISAGGNFINSVTFFDQTAGMYITREMYVSDRSANMWRRDPKTQEVLGWLDCSLSLIEV